ncbi:MAG: pyridoxine 5'-phosphate synthase [Planctomycetales bacterium]|nr:pyridoxine 5'-phosphate synthase [Planctomycetales bacterium]
MPRLTVNVDHVATVREARKGRAPDPVAAALLVELAGAHGVTVHLREDRRHVQDRDVRVLREMLALPLNLEMGLAGEVLAIACDVRPDLATLVPERRQELTTEGGLDVRRDRARVADGIVRLREAGIPVSLFVDPEPGQIEAAREAGAGCIELHTGEYANARDHERGEKLERLRVAAHEAGRSGLEVHAGHGLDYRNVVPVARIPEVAELAIGHAIVGRAVLVGMERAVREMLALVQL